MCVILVRFSLFYSRDALFFTWKIGRFFVKLKYNNQIKTTNMKPKKDNSGETYIRPYKKSELALLYNPYTTPRSAVQTMMRWIKTNKVLWEKLIAIGFNSHRQTLFSCEVELIYRYIGKP
jgi:hypothetical protein